MSIDFSSLSPKALQKLISDAMREHKRKQKRAPIAKVRAKLTKMARSDGYSINELFGTGAPSAAADKPAKRGKAGRKSAAAGRKIAPKYHNPENTSQTWTGRGKAPVWFSTLIASGKTRDDLLIAK
ncbi:MAG: H-NS histone family protein [Lysobacteraceae bacterium]